jgi:hypothetical protein
MARQDASSRLPHIAGAADRGTHQRPIAKFYILNVHKDASDA